MRQGGSAAGAGAVGRSPSDASGRVPARPSGVRRHGSGELAVARWALLMEYDGRPFVGWQRQGTGLSVQEVLETAAAKLNQGAPVTATVAGRTDAGVHASAQVVQLNLPEAIPALKVRDALNYHMKPYPVVVLDVAAAP